MTISDPAQPLVSLAVGFSPQVSNCQLATARGPNQSVVNARQAEESEIRGGSRPSPQGPPVHPALGELGAQVTGGGLCPAGL